MGYQALIAIDPAVTAFLSRDPASFIEGVRIPWSGATLPVYDPATSDVIAYVADADSAEVDRAVRSAHAAFRDGRWRHMRPADREHLLQRFASLVAERGEIFAQLETLEQGKSINVSRMMAVTSSVDFMRFAAGLTNRIGGHTMSPSLPGGPQHWTAYTQREPMGVVAGIVPWNFPLLIALWKVMPAIAAGCSIVLKPSEVTPLTALLLAETAIEAGLPSGVFNVVTGTGSVAGAALTGHPLVAKISFTGSTETGKAIGRSAMDTMKRLTLELGGKNPAIVLKDADLGRVIPGLMGAAFFNGGQVCAAASRIYAEAPIYDDLVAAMDQAIAGLTPGAGMDPQASLNPLVSQAHQTKVQAYLDDARQAGGEVRSHLKTPDQGYFVAPALVLNPDDRLRLFREEVFGPLLGITRVANAEEAIARANDTNLGLVASLWTENLTVALNLIPRIDSGSVSINAHGMVDPAVPFGGYKQSGFGRDFGGEWLDAFTEIKSVCFAH